MSPAFHSYNQEVDLPILQEKHISLSIKREDLIHPHISGNKYRKLKYNLKEAEKQGHDTLLTFGGAFSNHILAVACAGYENGFKTIGIIRGSELVDKWKENTTLKQANAFGMHFCFINREAYRIKENQEFRNKLTTEFGRFYHLPEGGTNRLAIKGCEKILTKEDKAFDVICSSVGTGGTLAGLINSSELHQKVLGFSALKGGFLGKQIDKIVEKNNWMLENSYHFGGYAKVDSELIGFINDFKKKTGIPLDPIYTGKMIFGILDSIKNDRFAPESKILAIHTGGLQGIKGMNLVLKKKNLPTIL